ncbi:MAG: alpha/beta fold hydrolase [Paracoccaceae bacterium]
MRRLFAILMLVLAACTPRGEMVIDPQAAAVGQVNSVYVGTSRKLEAGTLRFDAGRSEHMALARYDISVPPGHSAGHIEWPKRNRPPDPATQFLTTGRTIYPTDTRFRGDLSQALRRRGGEATIFVHGFNNTFDEGIYRIAQLSHDLRLPGVTMHFSWPSAGSPLGYVSDRDSALFSRDGLEALIRQTRAAGARKIYLVAHSMGSQLTMETLRQIAISGDRDLIGHIGGVVLISPDIDVDVFREQASRIGQLPQPFVIFGSPRDRMLRLSALLTGQDDRVGTLADVKRLADMKVTYLDVEAFSTGVGHFNIGDNPALIQIFSRIADVDTALGAEGRRVGLLDGAVLTVQRATQIVLSPVEAVANGVRN